MKEQTENKKSTSQFLKTDGGKTKSNAIEIPSISLPKGGGAIKGIDEKFSVNAVNGTALFSIPLPVSPARGVSPNLSLSYNSGGGNGIIGLGWSLNLSSIRRKTDKKLPEYFDDIDSDTFLFSEAEDLVPIFDKNEDGSFKKEADDNYKILEKPSPDDKFLIRFYKPRIEGLYARIERWIEKSTSIIRWRIITKENVTTLFGWSDNARLNDPGDSSRVFEWMPEFVFDDKGNCAIYRYKHEDVTGFDASLLHNRNRIENGILNYTNIYLEKVLYGNKTPYKKFDPLFPVGANADSNFMFQTVFDYSTLLSTDKPDKVNSWDFRNDAFSEYKSGFEIRTTRLCNRVLLFHYFDELSGGSALVKSLNLTYDTSTQNGCTFLKSIATHGYIKRDGGFYTSKKLPDLEFDYQKHDWNKDVKTISAENLVHAPSGLDEQQYQFTDLFNEGLSGILTEQANGWYYKHNLGSGNFEQAKLVSPKPSFAGLGGQLQLADLDADGGKQLVGYNSEPKGFFELTDDDDWLPFKSFENLPNINFQDPNARMIDLNGDGISDLLITEDNVFTWYESAGRKGFNNVYKTPKSFDEEKGPHLVFADSTQIIYLSDMSGDGLVDIVRIRNGEICYWPNLGYGKFGAKVSMDSAPVFDHPDSFNPSLLRLADIDGSGTSDIIYLGKNNFTCWMNLSGNSYHTIPFVIDPFPEINNQSKITVTDLLGNGVTCIVWSSNLEKDSQKPLKYIDLMNSKKPHIMISYKNNLGKEVYLEYTPSTKFYIEDKLSGKPWVTKLHFPVHCISKTETRDKISGYRFVSSYKYHHGYYDHSEREFRGFGMVEQIDSEHFEDWVKGNASNIVDRELHQEPVMTKSWFHTGAFLSREKILNQFAHEYWFEEMVRNGFTADNQELALPDARIIPAMNTLSTYVDILSAIEWREALRACKSMALRSEVFALDAPIENPTNDQIKKQLTPFTVSTHNCVIELIQPKSGNKHAIFAVKESEAITFSYERNTEDPRIAHTLNIKLDEYGNALESVSVVYQRESSQIDTTLPSETQSAQSKTIIIYTQNDFTNDVIGSDTNRLRLPSETRTYELKDGTSELRPYTISSIENKFAAALTVPYEAVDVNPADGVSQIRLIENIRSVYLSNDLRTKLALGSLESLAMPHENYLLAYTSSLLIDIFGGKIVDVNKLMGEKGKFENSEKDTKPSIWWIRSGTVQYTDTDVADAQDRFYMPVSYTDPYGAITKVKYYSNYNLFIEETEDALLNKSTVLAFNFRTLSPQKMQDPNLNISEILVDELGLPKAMAVMGKGAEADDLTGLSEFSTISDDVSISNFFKVNKSFAYDPVDDDAKDLLQHATARFVYDFDAYKNTGKPAVVASILREEHYAKNEDSPIQLSFEYSNGLGKVAMKKVQAEPGIAKKIIVNPDNTFTISDFDTSHIKVISDVNGTISYKKSLRWLGTGRTILNNKGNPIKQYEPYFSVTHQYEDFKELVESGVTPVMFYDAMGRMVKTEFPDGTLARTEFDSWKQIIYDQNDTVLESNWYIQRGSPDPNITLSGTITLEQRAAWLSAKHANTPTEHHFDTLGRPILQVENNGKSGGSDILYKTKADLDIEGNIRSVTDARNNVVMKYKYDMLGNMVYQDSMDAGKRWLLHNIIGNPVRNWDERNHEFQFTYDVLHRPLQSIVKNGDGVVPLDNIYESMVYGETITDSELKNLRGKPYRHFDTAGLVETPDYDFAGQPKSTTRKLFVKYKEVTNWNYSDLDKLELDSIPDLEIDEFMFKTETDALGRITKQKAPDNSVITPSYNEAGLLNAETVKHLNPDATNQYIVNIDYNEKGQRNKIIYGNDMVTTYEYDKETFHLLNLITKRQNNSLLQELYYTYDGVGNITNIEDRAIPTVFFDNMIIEPANEYVYDALYRLTSATGRENNISLNFDNSDNWSDSPFMQQYFPGDPMATRKYTQSYQYDEVGNILQMSHSLDGTGNGWTRNYQYETGNNRLISTQVGTETYLYHHHDKHGYLCTDENPDDPTQKMKGLPHLEVMKWNFKEELFATSTQYVKSGTPETTYYQYDSQGQRIRKITENYSATNTPSVKEERIYISGFETYRTYNGTEVDFERESLSLLEKEHRFAMVETVKQNNNVKPETDASDKVGARLIRYQHHNHIGSASLELDDTARVISYEEYHPYGTTAFQAKNAAIKSAAKRYRYTGMERDEESGLEYHSARYYLPWLGRWCSPDPIGIGDGMNVYKYGKNNPTIFFDSQGTQSFSKNRYHIARAHKQKAEIKKPEKVKVELQKPGRNKPENAIPEGGVGAIIGAPPGPTLKVPDTYNNIKMEALAKKVVKREAGPVTDTKPLRTDPAHKAAEAEFKRTVPKPEGPPGTKYQADHIIELQHDVSGKSGTRVKDFQWQEGGLNSSEGVNSMHLKKNLTPTRGTDVINKVKPATKVGAIEKVGASRLTSVMNSPVARGVMRSAGTAMVVYGLYQSGVEIEKGYELDIKTTGSIGKNTIKAASIEAGGWAGASILGSEGALAGAALGSVVPILGTAIGGFVGGIVGGAFGYFSGKEIVTAVAD